MTMILNLPTESQVTFNTPPQIYRCEPEWSWQSPTLKDYDLWCVLEGEGQIKIDETPHEIGSGDCFILKPGLAPLARHNPRNPLVVFATHFDLASPNERSTFNNALETSYKVLDFPTLRSTCRQIVRDSKNSSEYAQARARLGFWQLIFILAESKEVSLSNEIDPMIRSVANQVEEQPSANWDVDTMATLAGYSKTHFTRLFSKHYTKSPKRFVIDAKISRARQLLQESQLPIKNISDALGFCDVYFFTRQFKRRTGKTPGQVRKESK